MGKFLRFLLTLLLLVVVAIIGYGVWMYRTTGTIPFQLPGMPTPVLQTPTPTITPTPTPTPIMGQAVVAARPIARGEKLTKENLRIATMPQKQIPNGATTDPRNLYGLLAIEPIPAGKVVTIQMALPPGHVLGRGSYMAHLLKPGQVAIAFPIHDALQSVGYAPRAGDAVDVVVTFLFTELDLTFQSQLSDKVLVLSKNLEKNTYAFMPAGTLGKLARQDPALAVPVYVIPAEKQRPQMVARLVIRGARVLYFGHDLWPATPTPMPRGTPRPHAKPTPTATPSKPDMMVLAVSPQDAVVLNYFMARHASLTLALRSAYGGEEKMPETVPVSLDYIIQHYGVPVPAKLPYQIQAATPTP